LVNIVATRLLPGTDLFEGIQKFTAEHGIRAGTIIACHASLSRVQLRHPGVSPDAPTYFGREENFDIATASGVVSTQGSHMHLVVVDAQCNAFGGHVEEGCIVRTTAEVVIAVESDLVFDRALDPSTGFEELEVFEVVTPSPAPAAPDPGNDQA
jgi:uncharacterized protein